MRTALNRTALLALAAAATLGAGCSYSAITGAIEIDVTGVPESAVRAEAVITDSTNATITREPHFGTGVYLSAPLVLTFPSIASGAFTVQVTAYDIDDTPLAAGSGAGSYTPATDPSAPLPVVGVFLSSNNLQGTYGAACILTGTGSNECSGALICKQYSASDQGVCTTACNGNATCGTSPPGAVCDAFLGTASDQACQWECGVDGGSCPPGLTCGSAIAASGGKRFCEGSP